MVSSVKRFFSAAVSIGRSRSSKVIDFGIDRKLKGRMRLPINSSTW